MDAPEHRLNHEIIDDLSGILGEGFGEIVREQVAQGQVYLRELQRLLGEADAERAMRCAHALKSSAGQIGLQGIHALAWELERICKEDMARGEMNPRAMELHRIIAREFPHAVQALQDYISAR